MVTPTAGFLLDRAAQAMAERVRALDAKTKGKTTSQRAKSKLPCAFLVDGSCAIYSVSFEDEAATQARIQRGELKPTFLGAPQHVYGQALNGTLKTLHFAGLADYGLELTAAVRELLDQPKRMAAWLKQRAAPKSAALVPDPGADLKAQFR